MSRYVDAVSVTNTKRVRDHLKHAGQGAPVSVTLQNGATIKGTRTYIGTLGFGLVLADGSRTSVKYADVDWVFAPLKKR